MAGVKPFAPLGIGETLKQDHKLAALLAQARLHDRLLGKIRQTLPEPLGAHCLYCVLRRGGQLILYTDSAAWASKLRFYQSELRSAVGELGPLNSIQVRVLLPTGRVEKPPRLSIPAPEVLDQLEQNAATAADPQIKRALQRLARTLRRAAQSGKT